MADTVIIEILDELLDRLNSTGRPADVPEVTLRRTLPDEQLREPRMAIFLGDETVEPPRQSSNADPLALRRRQVAVQCIAPTDDLEFVDRATQHLVSWAVKVLGRAKAPEIGLLSTREIGTTHRVVSAGLYIVHDTVLFELTYQTRRNDLTRVT